MGRSTEKTSLCSNIQIGNTSANIDSRMAILLSSVAQNPLERKPSKGLYWNAGQPALESLSPSDQKTSEKVPGDLTGGQIVLRMIGCKKHLKCFILLRATEEQSYAMLSLDKYTIQKKTPQCLQKYLEDSIAQRQFKSSSTLPKWMR